MTRILALAVAALAVAVLPVHGADEIRVGVIQPLSGKLAPYGKPTLDGVKLRVKQINDAGGINGQKIRLIVEDNKGEKTPSRNAFTKLVGNDRVHAIVAPVTSTNSLAIRRLAEKYKIPCMSPTATNDKVTQRNPYMFRACYNDSFQGTVIANYAFGTLGIRRAAVIKDMNSDYSKGLSKSFVKAFTAQGGTIAAEESYQQGDTTFTGQLKKVKSSGAGLVFIPGYPPEVPRIVKEAGDIGLNALLCGADGWDNEAVITGSGPRIQGAFIVGAFAPEDKRPVVQEFLKHYQAEYKVKPGTFEALGYDTMNLLAEGLTRGTDPQDVLAGLHALQGFEAVTGRVTIDAEGDAVKSAVIMEITPVGDAFTTRYKATVAP